MNLLDQLKQKVSGGVSNLRSSIANKIADVKSKSVAQNFFDLQKIQQDVFQATGLMPNKQTVKFIGTGLEKFGELMNKRANFGITKLAGDAISDYGKTANKINNEGLRSINLLDAPRDSVGSFLGSEQFRDFANTLDLIEPTGLPIIPFIGKADEGLDAIRSINKIDEGADILRSGRNITERAVENQGFLKKLGQKVVDYTPDIIKDFAETVRDNYVLSEIEAVGKQGPSGRAIVSKINEADSTTQKLAGEAMSKVNASLRRLNSRELETFSDVVEGNMQPLSEAQNVAVTTWREIASDLAQMAIDEGKTIKRADGSIVPFAERANFFPHITVRDLEIIKKNFDPKSFDFMTSLPELRTGNLGYAREANVENYIKDPRILFNYIENSYRNLVGAKIFGNSDEVLRELVNQVVDESGNYGKKIVEDVVNSYRGTTAKGLTGKRTGEEIGKVASKVTRTYQVLSKMDLSAVTNAGQSLSTAIATNPRATAKAMAEYFLSKSGRQASEDFAIATGKLMDSTIMDVSSLAGAGDSKIVEEFFRLTGFSKVERFNKVLATNAGKEHARELAMKVLKNNADEVSIRALKDYGIDATEVIKNGGLTRDMEIDAGRAVVEKTQFALNSYNLPHFTNSEFGKVITQFKSFSYHQFRFMLGQTSKIVRELKLGNPRPLINTLATVGVGGAIVGEIINDTKSILRGEVTLDSGIRSDEEPLERYLNNVFAVASLGLLSDVGTLVTGQYGFGGAVGAVGGPTAQDLYNSYSTYQDAINYTDREKKAGETRMTPIINNTVSALPFIGKPIKNLVLDENTTSIFDDMEKNSATGNRGPRDYSKPVGSDRGPRDYSKPLGQ